MRVDARTQRIFEEVQRSYEQDPESVKFHTKPPVKTYGTTHLANGLDPDGNSLPPYRSPINDAATNKRLDGAHINVEAALDQWLAEKTKLLRNQQFYEASVLRLYDRKEELQSQFITDSILLRSGKIHLDDAPQEFFDKVLRSEEFKAFARRINEWEEKNTVTLGKIASEVSL